MEAPDFSGKTGGNNLKARDFQRVRHLIMTMAGISLSQAKQQMVVSRLIKRLRSLHLDSFASYIDLVERDENEQVEFINALTTNKTEFFREIAHFDYLRKIVFPDLLREKQDKKMVRIWSAASSSGQEVYTLAMLLDDFFSPLGWNAKVLGTDIDTEALEKASRGVYNVTQMEGIPDSYLRKYFLGGKGKNEGHYRIHPQIQEMVKFRQFNLVKSALPQGMQFDVIFLRNVLIYFDRLTTERVVTRLANYLKTDGYFFVGHSENLNGLQVPLKLISSAIYKKVV